MVCYYFFEREDPSNVADSLDTAKECDVPVVMVVPVAPLRGGGGQEGGGRGLPRRNGGGGGGRVEQRFTATVTAKESQ